MVEFKHRKTGEVSYRLDNLSLGKCEESLIPFDGLQYIYEISTTIGARVAIHNGYPPEYASNIIKDCKKMILHELFKDIILELHYVKKDIYEGNDRAAIDKINSIFTNLTTIKDE